MSTKILERDLTELTKEYDEIQQKKIREASIEGKIRAKRAALAKAQKADKRKAAEPLIKVEAEQLRAVVKLTLELEKALGELEATGVKLAAAGLPKANISPYLRNGIENSLKHWRNWSPQLLGLKPRK